MEEKAISDGDLADLNDEQQRYIVQRANELKERLPEKATLFEGYIQSQQAEWDELENEIMGVTLLLQSSH